MTNNLWSPGAPASEWSTSVGACATTGPIEQGDLPTPEPGRAEINILIVNDYLTDMVHVLAFSDPAQLHYSDVPVWLRMHPALCGHSPQHLMDPRWYKSVTAEFLADWCPVCVRYFAKMVSHAE